MVARYGAERYKMWIIGASPDPDTAKEKISGPGSRFWIAQTDEVAAKILQTYADKGMCPDSTNQTGRIIFIH
jgi:hypothetical protein